MSSNIHLEAQTTKKFNLPLSHLDYSYIDKCTNVKELEKIVNVLRSGEEGKYPDLERYAEKRLGELSPKSRTLRKDGPILRPGDLGSGDWKSIEEDLMSWTNSMQDRDAKKGVATLKTPEDVVEQDENLPPVRSNNVVLEGKKQKISSEAKAKRVMPRDYREWDKVDIDAELEKVDKEEKNTQASKGSKLNGVAMDIDATGLSEEQKQMKANREKDKGNEAFRSHDYEESVTYYSRSISLSPLAASYNNRALAYLKLEKWDKAIKDCNSVLNLEIDNIKALLRRGTAYKSKKDYQKAVTDFEKVLKLEPQNKKAEGLLEEVHKQVKKEQKEKGKRMVIEEVEEDSGEEEAETIEVEKPVVNGFGRHKGDEVSSKEVDARSSACKISEIPPEDTKAGEPSGSEKKQITKEEKMTSEKCAQSRSTVTPNEPQGNSTADRKSVVQDTASQCSKKVPVNAASEAVTSPEEKAPNSSALSPPAKASEAASASAAAQSSTLSSSSSSSSSLSVSENASPSSSAATQESQPSSQVSFSLEETTSEAQAKEDAPPSSVNSQFVRPTYVQMPLPPGVLTLKEEGNKLFRSGQYGEAVEQYSKAISKLEKDQDQQVNISVLLSNRAACHLKTGNCSAAVSDCGQSLQLVPHSAKALLRRAAAYETLEKYGDAYVDYKHVLSVDMSTQQAQQGASRCQSTLQQRHGSAAWREKIPRLVLVQPWEVPEIVDQAGLHKSMSSTVSLSEAAASPKASPETTTLGTATTAPSASEPPASSQPDKGSIAQQNKMATDGAAKGSSQSTSASKKEQTPTKEETFEALKTKGNQHVQKGEFVEAASCYTRCLSLCPDQVACYTNRALCYLKLNKAAEAEADCNQALSFQSTNPKALYRRALARKSQQLYKQSLQDLIDLLRVEPKNTAAKKEMEVVKKCYKEELEKLKQKKQAPDQDTKLRKRMKIEEVDDEEEEEKPVRVKAGDKMKSQSKLRGAKSSQPSLGVKSKGGNAEKKSAETTVQSPPVAPPIAPRLMKTTPYEFCQAWNSLKPCQGIQPYAEILRQVAPVDLASVISNKLDGQMLQIIVRCVYEEMVLKGEVDQGYQILDNLCKVPRFSTVSMFMTSKEKKEVAGVLDILSKTSSSAYSSADVLRLKKEYSVK
ncbi:sperm-associated antigen 1 isoform X2 [Aplysia californica]|uniref:Sperm-associated antigen 1 isoform X2 n=1 Tax=Aplysia californica TaxID=6500 RepID=A0ABM0K5Y7_APLCA|nr:sperm-associated antigen 1 isoform X2 [Aplysia californica]